MVSLIYSISKQNVARAFFLVEAFREMGKALRGFAKPFLQSGDAFAAPADPFLQFAGAFACLQPPFYNRGRASGRRRGLFSIDVALPQRRNAFRGS